MQESGVLDFHAYIVYIITGMYTYMHGHCT